MSKPASQNIQPRTVKAWCVVDKQGDVFLGSIRSSRALASAAVVSDPATWANMRRAGLVKVVRCSITTEVTRP